MIYSRISHASTFATPPASDRPLCLIHGIFAPWKGCACKAFSHAEQCRGGGQAIGITFKVCCMSGACQALSLVSFSASFTELSKNLESYFEYH